MNNKTRVATVEEVKALDKQVQDDITKLPAVQQNHMRELQSQVQSAIDAINEDNFSEAAFAAGNRAHEASAAGRGKQVGQIFLYKNNILIKTPFDTVIPAQSYVDTLSDQIIGVTGELSRLQNMLIMQRELLTVKELFKLMFKRIFKGRQ